MKNLLKDEGVTVVRFANAEGKEWMVPAEGIKTGLLLYQPSGWKGRWLKRVLPWLAGWNTGRRLMHVTMTEAGMNDEICDAIKKAFGVNDFQFAIFFGTPCADQKVTIQVYQGKKVMGYCKVADKVEIAQKFKREAELLSKLNERGLQGIPQATACGQTTEGLYYFAQTTTKSLKSTYPHLWGEKQESFLDQMHRLSRTTLPYEETDFYANIISLEKRIGWIDDDQQTTVEKAIDAIHRHFRGKTTEWSAYHGDFTPWNTFVEGGQLFVFDWEYALKYALPGMDRYHWMTQGGFFENHRNADEIFEDFKKKFGKTNNFSYLCYLITTIAIYVGREKSAEDAKNVSQMDFWTRLINLTMQK